MTLSAAERQRRCREKRKLNPEMVAEVRRKDLERYHARKKLVKDLTPKEHKKIKRQWRIRNKKRRDQQKALQNVFMNTPTSIPPPSRPRLLSPRSLTPVSFTARARGRKQRRRDRSLLYRQNIQLQDQNQELLRKVQKYKKRYQRKKKQENKVHNTTHSGKENEHGVEENRKYSILSNAIKKHYKDIKDHKTKRYIKSILQDPAIQRSRIKLQLAKEAIGVNRVTKYNSVLCKNTILKQKIYDFYLRDDVSRATAGKRETVTYQKTKKQKRIMLDTKKNLYLSFQKENPDVKCHYSYFAKFKPFYVVPPSIDSRETCMCKVHANIAFMRATLYKNKVIKTNDMSEIISQTVCDINSLPCMKGKCGECKKKKLKYDTTMIETEKKLELPQWVRTTEIIEKNGRKVKISKNIKQIEKTTAGDLIKKFEDELIKFKSHIFNIKHQYKSYRQCIDKLKETEIALHIDFSENYACKYHEEIQSVHFGGSRNQVALHTSVLYHVTPNREKHVTSFCTVSSDLQHGPAAIWAHLHPILDYVRKELFHVKMIHIFSDGPATQYKQKINFYLIATRFFKEYGFDSLTWNFFESGHGKGAADGVGGSIKRLADQFVASGHDIVDALQFFDAVNNRSKTKVFYVGKDDIALIMMTIPQDIVPLKGTMEVHQLLAQQPGMLSYRMLSCFCDKFCDCYKLKTYYPLPKHETEIVIPSSVVKEPLTDTNIIGSTKELCKTVYTSTSDDKDDQPFLNLKKSVDTTPGTSHDLPVDMVHPLLINNGTHLLIKVASVRKIEYTYLGVAKGGVDEDGDVRVMFYKSVDDNGKLFKLVESDVSDVMFENLLQIIPPPKVVKRGRRVFYEFDQSIEIFEK